MADAFDTLLPGTEGLVPARGRSMFASNVTRRVDFALFMVAALENDGLFQEAPAIVGCQSSSAILGHPRRSRRVRRDQRRRAPIPENLLQREYRHDGLAPSGSRQNPGSDQGASDLELSPFRRPRAAALM